MAEDPTDIWEFIPIENYQRPSEPTTEAVRKGLLGLWDRFRGRSDTKESVDRPRKWRQPPDELLDEVAPVPNWQDATRALNDALECWLEAEHPAVPVQLVLAPPHSGVSEIATCWAKRNEVKLVEAPSTTDILSGGEDWLSQLDPGNDKPIVAITKLEKCYLRHYDGLTLMRRLIQRVTEGDHHWVLACDSWAWAFLRKIIAIERLMPPLLTLRAFDHSLLERALRTLAHRTDGADFEFFQAGSDKQFPLSEHRQVAQDASDSDNRSKGETRRPVAMHLRYIAGYSRGLFKIAWSIWRRSLQLPAVDTEQESALLDSGHVLWIQRWSELLLPTVPPQCGESDLLMLHGLLLHGGLETDVLPTVLPCNPNEIMQSLQRLHAWQLILERDGRWEVSPLGYPDVRHALKIEGYLVDDF